jgi:hypothetical protein
MYFFLYAAGLIGLCFAGAYWLTRPSNVANQPCKDAEPRSPRDVAYGDALDWAVTLLVLGCYAGVIWMFLPFPSPDVVRAFALPVPACTFGGILTLQVTTGRPSWAGVIVITLGLLAVAAFFLLPTD